MERSADRTLDTLTRELNHICDLMGKLSTGIDNTHRRRVLNSHIVSVTQLRDLQGALNRLNATHTSLSVNMENLFAPQDSDIL